MPKDSFFTPRCQWQRGFYFSIFWIRISPRIFDESHWDQVKSLWRKNGSKKYRWTLPLSWWNMWTSVSLIQARRFPEQRRCLQGRIVEMINRTWSGIYLFICFWWTFRLRKSCPLHSRKDENTSSMRGNIETVYDFSSLFFFPWKAAVRFSL